MCAPQHTCLPCGPGPRSSLSLEWGSDGWHPGHRSTGPCRGVRTTEPPGPLWVPRVGLSSPLSLPSHQHPTRPQARAGAVPPNCQLELPSLCGAVPAAPAAAGLVCGPLTPCPAGCVSCPASDREDRRLPPPGEGLGGASRPGREEAVACSACPASELRILAGEAAGRGAWGAEPGVPGSGPQTRPWRHQGESVSQPACRSFGCACHREVPGLR